MIIAQKNDKFFSRLLSKEERSSAFESSFRFFCGESSKSSVPFRWESQPGTPKHPLSAASLPPLTPPPSYHSSSSSATARLKSSGGFIARSSSLPSKFLQFPFSFSRRCSSKKTNNVVAPSISSSSCSSSFSLPPATPTADSTRRRNRSGSDFRMKVEEMYRDDGGEQLSCSGGGRGGPADGKSSKSLRASRSWLCFNNLK